MATNLHSRDAVAKIKSNTDVKIKGRGPCAGAQRRSGGLCCPPNSELLILPSHCPNLLPTLPLILMFQSRWKGLKFPKHQLMHSFLEFDSFQLDVRKQRSYLLKWVALRSDLLGRSRIICIIHYEYEYLCFGLVAFLRGYVRVGGSPSALR